MDPAALTERGWQQISQALDSLWLFLGMASMGLALILFQTILASLVSSRHLSAGFLKLRMFLYPMAGFSLLGAAWLLIRAITHALSALQIYPRFWM